jgi:hypothetical protein
MYLQDENRNDVLTQCHSLRRQLLTIGSQVESSPSSMCQDVSIARDNHDTSLSKTRWVMGVDLTKKIRHLKIRSLAFAKSFLLICHKTGSTNIPLTPTSES